MTAVRRKIVKDHSMKSLLATHTWRIATVLAVILFACITLGFLLFGQVNPDEGWYLYASNLVYQGQMPYRDFAYTQPPLLPYIYGLAQTLPFSPLYLGRITTGIFSTIGFFLAVILARNYAGAKAGAVTAWLWATFTIGIYFQTITKTYALTTLFLLLAVISMSYKMEHRAWPVLETTFSLLATLTRASAFFFAFPIVLYALITAPKRVKIVLLALCSAAALWVLSLSLPNLEAARWGLLTHHLEQWGDITNGAKLREMVTFRLPALLLIFPMYALFSIAVILVRPRQVVDVLRHNPTIGVTSIGLLFFLMPNVMAGSFHAEYFVPLLFVLFPIVGILYVELFRDVEHALWRIILHSLMLSTLMLGLVRGGSIFLDVSERQLSLAVEEVRRVSKIISENSDPDDEVYALEALPVVVEAKRPTLPNMTMAQFSFFYGPTFRAQRLHLVNDQMILNYLENGVPEVVVLTSGDWEMLRNSAQFAGIKSALDTRYERQVTEVDSDSRGERIQLYLRRE